MHSSNLLFRGLHQLHHSAERLDVASAFWFAPLDMMGYYFSDKAMRSTTRSMVRMGSELVEGGLSSFLGDRGRRRDDSGQE